MVTVDFSVPKILTIDAIYDLCSLSRLLKSYTGKHKPANVKYVGVVGRRPMKKGALDTFPLDEEHSRCVSHFGQAVMMAVVGVVVWSPPKTILNGFSSFNWKTMKIMIVVG